MGATLNRHKAYSPFKLALQIAFALLKISFNQRSNIAVALLCLGQDHAAEALSVVLIVGALFSAIGRADAPGTKIKSTSADDFICAAFRPAWIFSFGTVIGAIPIARPFPNIACHIQGTIGTGTVWIIANRR